MGAQPLVFVGGTGRSGTHVVARVLGRHSAYYGVPIECRFHCNPGGLADFVEGRTDARDFTKKLQGFWWRRARIGSRVLKGRAARLGQPVAEAADGNVRGLHKLIDRATLDAAVKAFETGAADDPLTASRNLFYDLLSPLAAGEGKHGIVEMSCFTIAAAGVLGRIFPEAKFIHTVRDGRDAGSSKVGKRQKPKDPSDAREGVAWWEGRLRAAEAGAAALGDPARLLTISFDRFVSGDREAIYSQILDFLGLDDEQAMRDYFAGEVSADEAHRDRWRQGLDTTAQEEVTALYEQALDRLEAGGARSVPLLREVLAGEALSQ